MKVYKSGKWLYRKAFRIGPPVVHGWRTNWKNHYEYKQFLWWLTERYNLRTDTGRYMAGAAGLRPSNYV